jgi:hypothetical protein
MSSPWNEAVRTVHHVEGPRWVWQPVSNKRSDHGRQSTLQRELHLCSTSNGHGQYAIVEQVVPKARNLARSDT